MARPRRARRSPPLPTSILRRRSARGRAPTATQGSARRACDGVLGACVMAVAWINGFLFGCAEDVSEWLSAGRGFEAEAEYGFRSGVWWEGRR